jgi:hypothetical protein
VTKAWFSDSEDEPLVFFAGVWTLWKGMRKVRMAHTNTNFSDL